MMQFENVRNLSKDGAEAAMMSLDVLSKGVQHAAADAGEFAKRSFEHGTEVIQKLAATRTLDKALEVQGEFVRTSYENFVAQAAKVGTHYTNLAREAFAPIEAMVSRKP
jgi:hypothetical protein